MIFKIQQEQAFDVNKKIDINYGVDGSRDKINQRKENR